MVLLAYRHGFRASEVCDLEWSAIDFARAEMHVSRRKAGKPATHPIPGDELRELRKLRKESTGWRRCVGANWKIDSLLIGQGTGPGTAWGKAPCSGPCAECPYDPDSPGLSVYRARHRRACSRRCAAACAHEPGKAARQADRLRLLIVAGGHGAFVAAFGNRAEIVLAHVNRQPPNSAALPTLIRSADVAMAVSLRRGMVHSTVPKA
jgi:Phage integrase family